MTDHISIRVVPRQPLDQERLAAVLLAYAKWLVEEEAVTSENSGEVKGKTKQVRHG